MRPILTVSQIREIEQNAISAGIDEREMVLRAAKGGWERLKRVGPNLPLVVVCGKGNNGADGLQLAMLAHLDRREVSCVMIGAGANELNEQLQSECRAHGIAVVDSDHGLAALDAMLVDGCLIIDAIFGIGLRGSPEGSAAAAISRIRGSGQPVLSLDIPSGVWADSGAAPAEYVVADWTQTFIAGKPFMAQGVGLEASGAVEISDLGLHSPNGESAELTLFERVDAVRLMPQRGRAAHKGDSGKVLLVCGSEDFPGAALMAAMAALRSGAGLVKLATPVAVREMIAAQLPEVIHVPVASTHHLVKEDAGAILEHFEWADSVLIGPGLGATDETVHLISLLLNQMDKPGVLDADGLRAFDQMVNPVRSGLVLTPHAGEFARLSGEPIARVWSDRIEVARGWAKAHGTTLLLKGPGTLVADLAGRVSVNTTGNPGMATGGMGDVLSGVLGTLLAQGLGATDAARLAAWWHGASADHCAEMYGSPGYRATEVALHLPEIRAKLGS